MNDQFKKYCAAFPPVNEINKNKKNSRKALIYERHK